MRIRPYIQGDVIEVIGKDLMIKFEIPFVDSIDSGLAWTFLNGDYFIVGVGGFRRFWSGVYEGWLAARSYEVFFQHKLQVIKFIKNQITKLNAHRIQATILSDSSRDRSFVEFLGFHYEATLLSYGPDKKN